MYTHLIKEEGFPFHGRFFISPSDGSYNHEISIEWKVPSEFTHFNIRINGQEKVFSTSVANPLISLWLGYTNYKVGNILDKIISKQVGMFKDREIGFSFHHNSIFWSIWTTDMGWSNDMPKWMQGSFDFADFFLGKSEYSEEVLEEKDVKIKMPEAVYDGTAKLVMVKWKRARWFEEKMTRVEIDVPEGIPIPGKGENSWDCGPDATFGMSCPANFIWDGVNKLIKRCIDTRLKRCGDISYSERPNNQKEDFDESILVGSEI